MLRRVLAVLIAASLPGVVGPALPAHAEPAHARVVDITFPVAGEVGFMDDYTAARSGGRVHQATDIMAAKLQKVHAAMGGTVSFITGIDSPMPSYGYMLSIDGDDGLRYSYIHMNNDNPGTDDGRGGVEWAYAPDVRRGARVERGQWLGFLGDSGNAESTPPHLHFEMYDPAVTNPYGEHRLNPYASLLAAVARGDVPGAQPAGPESAQEPVERPLVAEPVVAPGAGAEAGAGPGPDSDHEPPDDGRAGLVERLAGPDRVRTSVALSAERYSSAGTVLIAPENTHPQALVAAPLAAELGAPVLLSQLGGLSPEVTAEVKRLGARKAYVIGSESQLLPEVEADLRSAGVGEVHRIAAADRYELSAQVADALARNVGTDRFDTVFLALGDAAEQDRAWPDALSATALAARLRAPILFVAPDDVPGAVREALARIRPATITVVGGTAAISDDVAGKAADAAGGARLERLAGPTRYETSVAVAAAGRDAGLRDAAVWVATGRNFPDALAAGPAAAHGGSPLVLVDGANVGGAPASERWMRSEGFQRVTVVGGTAAISEPVAEQLQSLLAG